MAAYISFQPSDFFNTVLYTGTGATRTVTGAGFQPDFTWIKQRNGTYVPQLYDTTRGAGYHLRSDSNAAQSAIDLTGLSAWTSDGFTLNDRAQVNYDTGTFASWNWKAGTTSGLSGGTITPSSYSINTTSGFGIYKYTGNSTSGATIAHGLGVVPKMIIVKRTNAVAAWMVYHEAMGNGKYMSLDTTAAEATSASAWNDTSPTSTLFSLGDGGNVNNSAGTYVAYVFSDVKGFSKFGSYTGNASATNGTFVYTGFRPAFILAKVTNYGAAWTLYDNKRLGYNPDNKQFDANSAGTEGNYKSDIYSNGFKPFTADPQINGSYNYTYMAFAEFPIVSSNSKAGTAR